MRKHKQVKPIYRDGERKCPVCAAPLPAHQTWPGAHYRFCGSRDCADNIKQLKSGQWVESNSRKCDREECVEFVAEGHYAKHSSLCCSSDCYSNRIYYDGGQKMTCRCGCGKEFSRKYKADKPAFSSNKCHARYKVEKNLASCGSFRPLVEEYLDGVGKIRYRDTKRARVALCSFFRYLNERAITNLDEVTSPLITAYLSWASDAGHSSIGETISYITTFFSWLICEGRREKGNPVLSNFHMPPKKKRKPRPLTDEQLDFTWQILQERGGARLRFAVAIASEGGLRGGEICNLRIEDVNITRQTAFVRLPNKTNVERTAHFGEETKKYFLEWMAERNPLCSHDHVLHNTRGSNWMTINSLIRHYNRVLLKEFNGKKINESGWDRWSGHRLRHTMATKLAAGGADGSTIMELAGWTDLNSARGYVETSEEKVRDGYRRSMRVARDLKSAEPRRQTLTAADVLNRKRNGSVQTLQSEDVERCV